MITEDEWSLILDLSDILFHFADATDYLGGSKYCTYSSINPAIIELIKWVCPALINNSNLTNIDFDRITDAFGEVFEPDRNREINIPVNTYNILK